MPAPSGHVFSWNPILFRRALRWPFRVYPESEGKAERQREGGAPLHAALIAGFIASKIVNKTGSGMLMDIALGVIGAIVGRFLASLLGIGGVTGVNIGSIIIAVIGAVVVLLVYRAVASRA